MAKLVITRGRAWRDGWRGYTIWIDGEKRGKIRAGSLFQAHLRDGLHRVQLSIDGLRSQSLQLVTSSAVAAILECGPGQADLRTCLRDNRPYIRLVETNGEDSVRAFLGQAARAVRSAPDPSLPLSRSDLSVLTAAARDPGSKVVTTRGSANDLLWTKLESLAWLYRLPSPPGIPDETRIFGLSEYGRVELLDVL